MEKILEYWPLIIAFCLGLIWFIRLESKVLYLEKDYENHKTEIKAKDKAMWDKIETMQQSLNTILVALGRVEGKLEKE